MKSRLYENSLISLGIVFLSTISTTQNCDATTRVLDPSPVQEAVKAKETVKVTADVCREHIVREEKSKGIDAGLLEAIAQIESKLAPYTVNASGYGHSFKTVDAAVQFIETKQKQGCHNISVGPMQLHLPSHRRHFKSIKEMIEPQKNISYAAKLLVKFKRQTGSMEKAVKMYHTGNPHAGEAYKNRVFGAWAKIRSRKAPTDLCSISARNDSPKLSHGSSCKKKISKKPIKIKFTAGAMASK